MSPLTCRVCVAGVFEDAEDWRLREKGFLDDLGDWTCGEGVLGAARNEEPGPVSADGSGSFKGSSRYFDACRLEYQLPVQLNGHRRHQADASDRRGRDQVTHPIFITSFIHDSEYQPILTP